MKVLPKTAYCMNLDSRTDRWENITTDWKKLSALLPIEIERVSAVPVPTKPSQGVARSIHKIINIAKANNLEYVLILEDDLYIIEAQKIVDCLENVPEDWDILSGGAYYHFPDKPVNEHWMKMKDFCSMHFIILHSRIWDKVLAMDGTQHIDRALGTTVRAGKMIMYMMNPMPCQQRPSFSDIRKRAVNDNTRKLPWLDSPNTLK